MRLFQLPAYARVLGFLFVAALALPSCDNGTGLLDPEAQVSLEKVGGDAQVAPVATRLPDDLRVLVLADGSPKSGVTVRFSVEGGGSLSTATAVSGRDGVASVAWTLGSNSSIAQSVRASIPGPDGLARAAITFTASSKAGTARKIEVTSGNNQVGPGSHMLVSPLVARVVDAFGNPVEGATVEWVVSGSGSGTVSPINTRTDFAGLSSARRTLGAQLGTYTTVARSSGAGEVIFTSTVVSASDLVPAAIAVHTGNAQTAGVGESPAMPLTVVVRSSQGYPVGGAQVRWSVVSGGGRVLPEIATTNGDGVATALVEFGGVPGGQSFRATLSATGAHVSFSGTAAATTPSVIERVGGEGQSGPVGTSLAPYQVRLTDRFGNPIANVVVRWTPSSGSMSAATTITDSQGRASSTHVLGGTLGIQTVSVSAENFSIPAAVFSASATVGAPSRIVLVSGESQVSAPLARLLPYTVRVEDSFGNVVPDAPLSWSAPAGQGSILPVAPRTDSLGLARASHTLGGTAGVHTVTVSASAGVALQISARAARVELVGVSGNNQSGAVGAALPSDLVVRLRDADTGAAMTGAAVVWTATAGELEGGLVIDTAGLARATWRAGPLVGSYTATAQVGGQMVSFNATFAGPRGEFAIMKVSGDQQSGTANSALAHPYVVRVLTAEGAPSVGATVTWSVLSGGGSVRSASSVTNSDGLAQVFAVLPGTVGAVQVVRGRVAALDTPIDFSSTVTSSNAAVRMELVGGNNQSVNPGAQLPTPLSVRILDELGRGVPGVSVHWSVGSGGGAISASPTQSDANGIATVTRIAGTVEGPFTTQATVTGLAGSPVVFTHTVVDLTRPAFLEIVSGNNQRGSPGATLPEQLVVVLLNANRTPITNSRIDWQVSGGGTISRLTGQTDGAGRASVGWVLGPSGDQRVQAASAANPTLAVTFAATFVQAARVEMVSGNNQSTTPGGVLAQPMSVRVVDGSDRPMAGVAVTWTIGSGGGSVSNTPVTTDANGIASIVRAAGTTEGTFTTQATVSGATGSPITFGHTVYAADRPVYLEIAAGDDQEGLAGATLSAPLSVRVLNAARAPIEGARVFWAVNSGGGFVSAGSVLTGPGGIGLVNWTLGTGGAQSVTASMTSTPPLSVIFGARIISP
jgi:hypothetical protein